ncbi:hypothetical protein Ga0100231_012680 [Opitutaceae bacterium TAV4]|nr:hypothetical protein Ga0100231_012680 [Opitutaceae bacterium TAV4]RRJ99296.1 hypothetical protein Ga0100230_013965 [Opitutaceae bacterium TAV3]
MKTLRILPALALLALPILAPGTTARAVVLSSLSSVPTENVNINIATQALTAEGVARNAEVRYYNAENLRTITQTFTWNSTLNMTGIGLLIAPDQGSKFSNNQTYALDIQELGTGRTVTSNIATVEFTLTSSLVAAEKLLYFSFDSPLSLMNTQLYGFNLRPTQAVNNNRLSLAVSGTPTGTDSVGNIRTGTVASLVAGESYGNQIPDGFAFFTTTAPVPELGVTVALLGGAAILAALVLRRRK